MTLVGSRTVDANGWSRFCVDSGTGDFSIDEKVERQNAGGVLSILLNGPPAGNGVEPKGQNEHDRLTCSNAES